MRDSSRDMGPEERKALMDEIVQARSRLDLKGGCDEAGRSTEYRWRVERFYMPQKFVPPFGEGDRYCFPDGRIWEISCVDIHLVEDEDAEIEDAMIVIHWRRPVGYDSEWWGKHRAGDTNWVGHATANDVWKSVQRYCPYCKERMVRAHYQNEEGDWFVCWLCGCEPDPEIIRGLEEEPCESDRE